MVEGGVSASLYHPINPGLQQPRIPFLIQDVIKVLLKLTFKSEEGCTRVVRQSLLNAIKSSQNLFLLVVNVAKIVLIPQGILLGK